ncbi:hypothetical protein J6590_065519 [Homalodisca vitripennis]|nr:hypothetical protein J6590_065519 [Homalodisca vitripennis]
MNAEPLSNSMLNGLLSAGFANQGNRYLQLNLQEKHPNPNNSMYRKRVNVNLAKISFSVLLKGWNVSSREPEVTISRKFMGCEGHLACIVRARATGGAEGCSLR